MLRPNALIVLLLACTPLQAEVITNPLQILKKERCAGGAGFFLWDSKRCLLEDDSLFLNGKQFRLTQQEWSSGYKKRKGVTSVGDRSRVSYRAGEFNLRIELKYLPAGCDYSNDQCTYRNYHATFKLLYPNGKTIQFQGVGYAGS